MNYAFAKKKEKRNIHLMKNEQQDLQFQINLALFSYLMNFFSSGSVQLKVNIRSGLLDKIVLL